MESVTRRFVAAREGNRRRSGFAADAWPTGTPRRGRCRRIAEHILKFPGIDQTLAHGENKVSFTLQDGLQVDVRLLEKKNFGAALLYFTGSKEHNVALARARE